MQTVEDCERVNFWKHHHMLMFPVLSLSLWHCPESCGLHRSEDLAMHFYNNRCELSFFLGGGGPLVICLEGISNGYKVKILFGIQNENNQRQCRAQTFTIFCGPEVLDTLIAQQQQHILAGLNAFKCFLSHLKEQSQEN